MLTKLAFWEPLDHNLFCNYKSQLRFFDFRYGKDFILAFENTNESELILFNYKNSQTGPAIMAFQFHSNLVRSDINNLINAFLEENSYTYEPTFFKVSNSHWINWYDEVFPARVQINPNAEHHLFLTDDLYIEVMSEQEPEIQIISKDDWL